MTESLTLARLNRPSVPGYMFGICGAIVPILAFFISKGIAPIFLIGSASILAAYSYRRRALPNMETWSIVLFATLLFWAAVTTFWSFDQESSAIGVLKLTGNFSAILSLIAVARAVDATSREYIGAGVLIGVAIALFLTGIEALFSGPIYQSLFDVIYKGRVGGAFWLNSASCLLSLMIWPALQFARSRVGAWIIPVAIAAVGAITIAIQHYTGLVALLCGSGVLALAWVGKRRFAPTIAAFVLVGAVVTPIAVGNSGDYAVPFVRETGLGNTVEHRIVIWNFAMDRIKEDPWTGLGMNSSKFILGGGDKVWIGNNTAYVEKLPLHPHNMFLQVWLELGIPGLVIAIAIVSLILSKLLSYRDSVFVALGLGQFTTALVFASVSYGIWQAWWLASLAFAASFMIAMPEANINETDSAHTPRIKTQSF